MFARGRRARRLCAFMCVLRCYSASTVTVLKCFAIFTEGAVSVRAIKTMIINHAPCHFMQRHIRKVHAYLAVTCHLYFWQNDRGLLCATTVTLGWNGYRNKSQYRKLTPEKIILPPLLQGFEPATFRSRIRRFNH